MSPTVRGTFILYGIRLECRESIVIFLSAHIEAAAVIIFIVLLDGAQIVVRLYAGIACFQNCYRNVGAVICDAFEIIYAVVKDESKRSEMV